MDGGPPKFFLRREPTVAITTTIDRFKHFTDFFVVVSEMDFTRNWCSFRKEYVERAAASRGGNTDVYFFIKRKRTT